MTNLPMFRYVKFRDSLRRVARVVFPVPGVPVTKILGIVRFVCGICCYCSSMSIVDDLIIT